MKETEDKNVCYHDVVIVFLDENNEKKVFNLDSAEVNEAVVKFSNGKNLIVIPWNRILKLKARDNTSQAVKKNSLRAEYAGGGYHD